LSFIFPGGLAGRGKESIKKPGEYPVETILVHPNAFSTYSKSSKPFTRQSMTLKSTGIMRKMMRICLKQVKIMNP
jgi:hypothetical protein